MRGGADFVLFDATLFVTIVVAQRVSVGVVLVIARDHERIEPDTVELALNGLPDMEHTDKTHAQEAAGTTQATALRFFC